jgi:hypothetical protein
MQAPKGRGNMAPTQNRPRHRAALYPRGKDPWYPLDRRLGGFRACMDTEARGIIIASAGNQTSVVQSVVKHYADWATLIIGDK